MRYRILGELILIAFCSLESFAQEQPKPILIDEFGSVCSEEVKVRLDNYYIQLNSDPTTSGAILFEGDAETEGRNLNLISFLTQFYPKQQFFDTARIQLIRARNSQLKVQFWIIPKGGSLPTAEQPFVNYDYSSATLFDRSWADFNTWFGDLDIYFSGFFENGCGFSPNRQVFADLLREDTKLNGLLIVYTKFGVGSKRGLRLSNFARNELTRVYRIDPRRIKSTYGGNRIEPEIDFWIVPSGSAPPRATPDRKWQIPPTSR